MSLCACEPGSPVLLDLLHDLAHARLRVRVRELTGSRAAMSAAAVLRHQLADVGAGGAVEDAVADGANDELPFASVEHAHLDVCLWEHRVDEKAIAGRHLADAAEVGDDHVLLDGRALAHQLRE